MVAKTESIYISMIVFKNNKCCIDKSINIELQYQYLGGVAQLARAREWHSRGHGFDSLHLHTYYV